MTDAELIAIHLAGDEKAFDVLVERHTPGVRAFLMRGQLQDLEPDERYEVVSDLVQEAWMRVLRHAKNFNPEKKFTTWLFTIALNLVRNYYRDRKRRALRLPLVQLSSIREELIQRADETLQPDVLCEQRDSLENLSKYLSKHAPRENVVVLELREMQGYTYEEIAEWLCIPIGTVKSRLSRVRAVVKRYAQEHA